MQHGQIRNKAFGNEIGTTLPIGIKGDGTVLKFTITNKCDDDITIDSAIVIGPDETYCADHVPGFYWSQYFQIYWGTSTESTRKLEVVLYTC